MIKSLLTNQPKRIVMPIFSCLIGIMLVVGIIAFQSVVAVRDATSARARSREILMHLELVQRHLDEADSGQRGYLLTYETHFLAEFNMAIQHLEGELILLREKLANGSHHTSLVELTDVWNKKQTNSF